MSGIWLEKSKVTSQITATVCDTHREIFQELLGLSERGIFTGEDKSLFLGEDPHPTKHQQQPGLIFEMFMAGKHLNKCLMNLKTLSERGKRVNFRDIQLHWLDVFPYYAKLSEAVDRMLDNESFTIDDFSFLNSRIAISFYKMGRMKEKVSGYIKQICDPDDPDIYDIMYVGDEPF